LFFLGNISFSINGVFFIPKNADSPDDIKTAERANQFEVLNIFCNAYNYLTLLNLIVLYLERMV
jgi:hypothetical protein